MITDFEFNDSTAWEEGLLIENFVSIPTPSPRYDEYDIPGRDGKLMVENGTYDDIVININLMYLEQPANVRQKYQETKRWLMSGKGKLKFSDQPETYYVVKKVEIAENNIKLLQCGKFTVGFTCHPYRYYDVGNIAIPLSEEIYNPYDASHPLYDIEGEGMCILCVNDHEFKANVGQALTVDSDLMIAYRSDSVNQTRNTGVSGDYTHLWLRPGINRISATTGFKVKVTPRWRCL